MKRITTQGLEIYVYEKNKRDYISLTDIARYKNKDEPKDVIKNWIKSRSTINFLGAWEKINNPNFKGVEFDSFKMESGENYFVLSPQKWIEKTRAIGIVSKSGNGGGTFAHKDIAFEFATWISPEFKLYLIKEFQRLKEQENERLSLGWDVKRHLTKINYRIHTDAIKSNLIPRAVTKNQATSVYASEADVLNVALFGQTAADWRQAHPKFTGNIRDYADVTQLVVLANLETLNAAFINKGMPQQERLQSLNKIAISQIQSLISNPSIKKLESKSKKEES
jgi:hypothetical protein